MLRRTTEMEEPALTDVNYVNRTQKNIGITRGTMYPFDELAGAIEQLTRKLTEGNK